MIVVRTWDVPIVLQMGSSIQDIKPRLDTNEYSGRDKLPDNPAQIDVTGYQLTISFIVSTHLVRYPLKLTGSTSDAYTVVTVW